MTGFLTHPFFSYYRSRGRHVSFSLVHCYYLEMQCRAQTSAKAGAKVHSPGVTEGGKISVAPSW